LRLEFPVPDPGPWRTGTPLPGVLTLAAPRPGPHAAIFALVHGNELSGAAALLRLIELGVRPERGRLTLCFANLDAFDRFDPAVPGAARFLEEDLNRLWDDALLDHAGGGRERQRARALRPLVREVDFLLDLHSMQTPGEPLLLCAPLPRSERFALRLGLPAIVVSDPGHESGRRLVDYAPFTDPRGTAVAVLLEAGPHGARRSVETAVATALRFLEVCGVLDRENAGRLGAPPPAGRQRLFRVERPVRVEHGPFRYIGEPASFTIVPHAGTTIAFDGGRPVRTPFDGCAVVLPVRRAPRGHVAMRLARPVTPAGDAAAPGLRRRPAGRDSQTAARR
jgi:predicted deacylase